MDHQSLDPLVALGYAVATIRLIPGLGAGYQKSEFFALSVAVPWWPPGPTARQDHR